MALGCIVDIFHFSGIKIGSPLACFRNQTVALLFLGEVFAYRSKFIGRVCERDSLYDTTEAKVVLFFFLRKPSAEPDHLLVFLIKDASAANASYGACDTSVSP